MILTRRMRQRQRLRLSLFVWSPFVWLVCGLALHCTRTETRVVLTPASELEALTSEAARWINFQAGVDVVIVGAGGVPVELCTPESIAREAAAAGVVLPPGDAFPCGYHSGRRICVSRCSDVADLSAAVLVHEIGHAILGAQHSRYRGSIMAAELQQLDLEEASRSLVSALP